VVEIAIAPVAEAVPGHLDRGTELAAVEQIGQLVGLILGEHGNGHGVAFVVENAAQALPVERINSGADVGGDVDRGCHRRSLLFADIRLKRFARRVREIRRPRGGADSVRESPATDPSNRSRGSIRPFRRWPGHGSAGGCSSTCFRRSTAG